MLAAEEFALMATLDRIDSDQARHQAKGAAERRGGQRGKREGRIRCMSK